MLLCSCYSLTNYIKLIEFLVSFHLQTSSIQNELIKKVGASSKLKHNGSSTSSVYTAWN